MRFADLKSTYTDLWNAVQIPKDRQGGGGVDWAVAQIIKNKARYQAAQRESGVWWPVIACIHALESSFSFEGHLHNGDSLSKRTWQVPAGRPLRGTPPFTWEHSAADALSMKQWVLDELGDLDTPAECLYFLENYNGWGYWTGAGRNTTPPNRSPYLWSDTNHYVRGKYVADGRFDRNAVSAQVGAAAILKALELAGVITFGSATPSAPVPEATERPYVKAPVPLKFDRTLKLGDKGEDVYRLLCALMGLQFLGKADKVTDVFNANVEGAVCWFQGAIMKETPDGVVGPRTEAALEEALRSARGEAPAPTPNTDPKTAMLVDTGSWHEGAWSGLKKLKLTVGADVFFVASGARGVQSFRRPQDPRSTPGNLEPIPQGLYKPGAIIFANGRDSYEGSHGAGLGPVWCEIDATFSDDRGAFGFHLDENRSSSAGSAGCVVFPSIPELQRWVASMRKYDPTHLRVDWKLG
jgi:lysozyme family protein